MSKHVDRIISFPLFTKLPTFKHYITFIFSSKFGLNTIL